jgi:hypothetical protein
LLDKEFQFMELVLPVYKQLAIQSGGIGFPAYKVL